ncbi:hypothetical protein FXO38_13506 [Capsicum annuum]|uniref:RNase H type-1 domain-containing protein n=1 Tax=Capsicum annuum TaxID=4072 RepID=A0A2G2ZXF8_CAPAN|nr:hypothetical protein FXO38_13506 [Capsicum annuum]KAF3680192.1 hypothetical protein FXO37_03450 [Capsicum annuum]PHT86654.1 hypothetical protein T459_08760 [Capsicum annuum]
MSCSICHAKGHNKKGCPLDASSTKSSVGSSAVADTKRGRGRGRLKWSTKAAAAATGRERGVAAGDTGRERETDVAAADRGKRVDVVAAEEGELLVVGRRRATTTASRDRGAVAAGRGRGVAATATIDGVGRGREPAADVTVGSTGRGREVTPVAGVGRGWIKYNIDGVSKENPGRSSWAYCLRDTDGNLLHVAEAVIEDTTSMKSEALAILHAAKHCNTSKHDKVIIQTDCLLMQKMLSRE